MSQNNEMHPRNPYKNKPPDFKASALEYLDFRNFCHYVSNGKASFDFREDAAVRCLTQTLLKKDFSLDVEIPAGHLVPRVPRKLNYCLLIDDILQANELTRNIVGIDIGTGTSCIHALIGARHFGWKLVATDVDNKAVHVAHENVARNGLDSSIYIVYVNPAVKTVLMDVMNSMPDRDFTFCMCNPPFFEKLDGDDKFCEEPSVSKETFSNRIDSETRPSRHSVTFASSSELYVDGGEVSFVNRIIDDSVCLRDRIKLYTTMIGRKSSLKPLQQRLQRFGNDIKFMVSPLNQGKTKRWMLAWTFSKSINLATTDRPLSLKCPKAGLAKLKHEINQLNGQLRQETTSVFVAEFKSVTWTNQRARKKARAILMENAAKRPRFNTLNAACQATFGTGDGKDSFTDAGNFSDSKVIVTANSRMRDNAKQAYFPDIPRPILRIRIHVDSDNSCDLIPHAVCWRENTLLRYNIDCTLHPNRNVGYDDIHNQTLFIGTVFVLQFDSEVVLLNRNGSSVAERLVGTNAKEYDIFGFSSRILRITAEVLGKKIMDKNATNSEKIEAFHPNYVVNLQLLSQLQSSLSVKRIRALFNCMIACAEQIPFMKYILKSTIDNVGSFGATIQYVMTPSLSVALEKKTTSKIQEIGASVNGNDTPGDELWLHADTNLDEGVAHRLETAFYVVDNVLSSAQIRTILEMMNSALEDFLRVSEKEREDDSTRFVHLEGAKMFTSAHAHLLIGYCFERLISISEDIGFTQEECIQLMRLCENVINNATTKYLRIIQRKRTLDVFRMSPIELKEFECTRDTAKMCVPLITTVYSITQHTPRLQDFQLKPMEIFISYLS